ncbi:MAG TPA: DUF3800 domain-containing protein [Candidatus Cloacimonadota bacterium]|nr:DUF3800 domain-containing protein [Candidatus Cloacimonadota bacterium]HQL15484.1 DUF3800 domain-containing protein [Candidatus Cloacimonadota bacterium]
MHLIFFDESGNLGSKFNGLADKRSTKYLTICFLQIPDKTEHYCKRIVKYIYRTEYNYQVTKGLTESYNDFKNKELKGSSLSSHARIQLIKRIEILKNKIPDLRIFAITVDKTKCNIPKWEQNRNLLYNYMVGIAAENYFDMTQDIELHPDPRSIKVGSANCLFDYLEIKLRYEHKFAYNIKNKSIISKNCYVLQLTDFICNMIWRNYEKNEEVIFTKLKPHLYGLTELFFRKHNQKI